jgi:uridine phosphorylase
VWAALIVVEPGLTNPKCDLVVGLGASDAEALADATRKARALVDTNQKTPIRTDDEPILRPRDFIEYVRKTSNGQLDGITDVLLCYDDAHFRAMVKELARSAHIRKRIGDVLLLKDSQMAVIGQFGIGAPAVVARCEELITCGVRRIVSLGTAATITHAIDIGDVVVCQKAFCDEGTSRHYFAKERVFHATEDLANEIHARLNTKGLRCKMGAAWTTDAPYRETTKKRDTFVAKGARVVEMEASALYMLAAYRNIGALSVVVVGDSVAESTWKPHFNDERVKMKLKQTGRELIELLRGQC